MKKERQSYTIWIEAEEWIADSWTPDDADTDVIVTREGGSRWVASFFSYKHIETLTKKNQTTGECLAGTYLWSSDMVLINEVSRRRIEEVVEHLIKEDDFENIFTLLPPEEEQEP